MTSTKNMLAPKQKSLSIHIHTNHIGPHGMPLVYGSTPDRVGFIKGTVRFSSNYDCKGRDIHIIYEAWVETHGEVAGDYEKEFEFPLIHPAAESARGSFESTSSSSSSSSSKSRPKLSINTKSPYITPPASPSSSPRGSPNSSTTSLPLTSSVSEGGAMVLPSSHYSPNTRVRYTIRAVLQRPFPSLSNYEASQEIWVVNSTTPRHTPISSFHTTSQPSSPVLEQQVVLSTPAQESKEQSEYDAFLPKDVLVKIDSPTEPIVKHTNDCHNKQLIVVYFCYLSTLMITLGLYKLFSS
ncbi:hypothetical protein BGZ49_007657 [Haplosporangium sp. Z 27]|nr:hypothetical protein BGZ49_007657 [Haplosporangium sp. Z 27]